MLRVKLRQAEEERYKVAQDQRDRAAKLAIIKRRYELMMGKMGSGGEDGQGSVGENGEERSQAYYIIRAAQLREELQKEGDDLDARIRKTERELKALENTLRLMNERNEKYRTNLYNADLSSKDLNQKALLDNQYGAAMDRYKALRQDIQHHTDQVRSLEEMLSSLSSDETRKTQQLALLETKMAQIERDVADCEGKRERAVRTMERLSKEIKRARDWEAKEPLSEEIDIAIKLAKDFTGTAMQKISDACSEEGMQYVRQRITELLGEAGIHPPSKPVSKAPSGMSSRAGSHPASRVASTNASRVPSRAGSVGSMARVAQAPPTSVKPVTIGSGEN
ncbi:Coiled-coil domain-containing protein 39 [Gonapodya sp. JEL0774]|nr:Coiled-coil domain-containing protein 39 [Gonapodya sp. JEL0774]